jgi:hypothetical protein
MMLVILMSLVFSELRLAASGWRFKFLLIWIIIYVKVLILE